MIARPATRLIAINPVTACSNLLIERRWRMMRNGSETADGEPNAGAKELTSRSRAAAADLRCANQPAGHTIARAAIAPEEWRPQVKRCYANEARPRTLLG